MTFTKKSIFTICALALVGFTAFLASSFATQIISDDVIAEEIPVNVKDPAMQLGFVPHKALYDIKLAGKKSGSQIVNIKGQMFYDWSSGCDGWNSNHRFNLIYEYADTPPMKITSDFSTYENFDGESFNFASQRKRDGALFEELRGAAFVNDQEQVATFSIPRDLSFDLKHDALFPMRHTMSVLEQIRKGKKFYKATIFDGSDEEGPIEINAFIGQELDVSSEFQEHENIDKSLLDNKAWKVQLAFFPLNAEESAADYEMTLTFHENGVISNMLVEYGDFTVSQKLSALEPIKTEACMNLNTDNGE